MQITFHLGSLTKKIDPQSGLNLISYIDELKTLANSGLYARFESCLHLPFEKSLTTEAQQIIQSLAPSVKYIVLIGIGGSNLDTQAIYHALFGSVDNQTPYRFPKMIFLDTCDSETVSTTTEFLHANVSPAEVLFILISKSGVTTESLVNAAILAQSYPAFFSRLVIITKPKSPLTDFALKYSVPIMTQPEMVGGRFAVFSAIGILPLTALKINTPEFLNAAADEIRHQLENPNAGATDSAIALFTAYQNGYIIHNTFLFHPELEFLGKWYKQLLAESIGKVTTTPTGEKRIGITPTVSIGTTDLHSEAQLVYAGPRNKITTLVTAPIKHDSAKISPDNPFTAINPDLKNHSTGSVTEAVIESVEKSYAELDLPYIKIALDELSIAEIGRFMQMKMIEVMLLGKLFNLNAFDQPEVEFYKKHLREILKSN